MSWDKSLLLGPVFALDTLRNRVNTILKNNQNRNNTQQGDYQVLDKRESPDSLRQLNLPFIIPDLGGSHRFSRSIL